ncbi:hypothetical protein [Pseudoduganella namucuonensis]|uniref:Uncharacterized protein n=1 Tax=Pseudoduganella namucuonensis TaxID=1035707 RepID=A0A1I7LPS4_9BURK|nr:hypothetical protein [Pseudoduganella namucuonensis]SFV11711.1 hypothetical protein SAMN05216552_103483 [Pseudoduganella namucuonensis]
MFTPRTQRARAVLATALAAALLFASGLGLLHRIAHGWNGEPANAAKAAKAVTHSCAAFDAATLADRLPASILHTAVCRQRVPVAPAAALFDPLLTRAAYFAARAPPSPL